MANKGGRPLKFKSNKELQERIDEYFDSCFEPAFDKKGKPIMDPRTGEQMLWQSKPFTMSGLAYFLEIDRKTLLNYGKKDMFFLTIKRHVPEWKHMLKNSYSNDRLQQELFSISKIILDGKITLRRMRSQQRTELQIN